MSATVSSDQETATCPRGRDGGTTDFTACIVRIGRRVLIDLDLLREWLARNRGAQLPR